MNDSTMFMDDPTVLLQTGGLECPLTLVLSDMEHTCRMYLYSRAPEVNTFCRSPLLPSDSDSDSELSEEEQSSSYASSHSSDSEDDDADVKPKWNNERTPTHSTPKSMCTFRSKQAGVVIAVFDLITAALISLSECASPSWKLQWEAFSRLMGIQRMFFFVLFFCQTISFFYFDYSQNHPS